jgi:uncharacterized protein
MKENKDVCFHEEKKLDYSGYTLIEGFPGMGLVGTIAAKFVAEKLEMDLVGHIDSKAFVPIIRIHKGYPVFPSRIYASPKHKVVVLISEQIISPSFTSVMADEIVNWIKKKKIKKVVSLSGIRAVPQGKNTIYGIASNLESKKLLKKFDVEVIKEGITSGLTAFILLKLKDQKVNAISLLGNVQVAADYKAAARIIEKLNEVMGFNIDVNPLEKEAKETEKALLNHLDQMKQVAKKDKNLEDTTVTGPRMYS